MAKKRASSSAKRGAGQSATRGGRQASAHQTRAQTRTQATPQPEVVNGGQPRVASEQVQEQVVQNKSGYYPRCSNCGRNHSGRCFGADGACFTCGEKGHIAKYCPKANSGASRATTQPQGTTTATQGQIQPARTAPQGAHGQGRQGAQVAQGGSGPPRFFAMTR
ncbi:uncharacterized protein LOC132644204 [Lycium barbarum]|uniref:uncharacterized protein LOC132644204 n=1 Tax=Lycium barbarum TaxID=112863 RepID=UPI00293E21C9|nr:uncharacterized protein LOC132644204 [Lycium barbarum]